MSASALLVTSGSRGIGRACALLAAENGWAVGVNYREDAKAADAVVETIVKGGGRAVALKGDVSVEADAVAMFDAATKALGPLTAVIANAGIVAPTAKLAEMSAERMRRIFEVNVLGAFLTAREAARRMSKSSGGAGGSIVLMSSAAARLGSPTLYIDYALFISTTPSLYRLRRIEGRDRHADFGSRQRAGSRGGQGQRHSSGPRRHRNPRQWRRARPGKDSGRDRSAGPPGLGRGDRCGGDLADQRRGFLRDRRAARRLRRALTAALSNSARRSRAHAG